MIHDSNPYSLGWSSGISPSKRPDASLVSLKGTPCVENQYNRLPAGSRAPEATGKYGVTENSISPTFLFGMFSVLLSIHPQFCNNSTSNVFSSVFRWVATDRPALVNHAQLNLRHCRETRLRQTNLLCRLQPHPMWDLKQCWNRKKARLFASPGYSTQLREGNLRHKETLAIFRAVRRLHKYCFCHTVHDY